MATRADNHDGSCRQVQTGRHKGKWRVQYILVDELKRKKRLSRLFERQAEAKEFLRGLRRGERVEAAQKAKQLTLGGWFDWLAENDWPDSLAESTIQARQARFRKYVRRILGEVPLTQIDPMVVKVFYRSLQEDGVGQATVLEIKRDMVRVFNQAIQPYRRVPITLGNPFKLTVASPARRDAVALTPEEAKKALQSKQLDLSRRAMLATYLLAGLRLSEQMALTKDQLLFDQDLIFIDRAIKFGKSGKQWIGLPKGDKKRLAVMCPSLKALLKRLTESLAPDQVIWSAASENKARMKKLVYATWRTIIKDAGLPAEMSPQDCRLSHVNWCEKLMPDVSTTTYKEHIGHAAEGVTQVNYTRPITTAQQILRDNIERVVGIGATATERNRDSAPASSRTLAAGRS